MDLITQTKKYLTGHTYQQQGNIFYIAHQEEDCDLLKLIVKAHALFLVTTIKGHYSNIPDLINDVNLETTYGNFDYDQKTNTLYYRASVDLNQRPYSLALLEHLCNAPLIDLTLLKKAAD